MTPFEKDGERFTPEEIVEIVRAFPDGAVDDTKAYFEALVRAHELLIGSEEYARYFKSNNVAPLRVNRCNPHVVRRKDVRGVVGAILHELEHLSEMLNTKGEALTDAIALLTRKDGEALETYTSELAEELNHTDLQFVQLRDERAQASVAGFLMGDIVTVETESGAHDLQVTGWDVIGAQVRNLTTNEAGKLRIKPDLNEQWQDAEGNKHDAYLQARIGCIDYMDYEEATEALALRYAMEQALGVPDLYEMMHEHCPECNPNYHEEHAHE